MRILIITFFISLIISCKSQVDEIDKLINEVSKVGYYQNLELTLDNYIATFKFFDTLTNAEVPAVFELYNEYVINHFYQSLSGVKQFNFFYWRTDTKKYVSWQYDKKDIDFIISQTSARESSIKMLFSNLSYKELSDIELAYYMFEKNSEEYKKIEHTFLELIIRNASECYLDEKEQSNYDYTLKMFNDTGHTHYTKRINEIVSENCD